MTREVSSFETLVWLVICAAGVVILIGFMKFLILAKNHVQRERANDRKPIQIVPAQVVAKRTHVSSSQSALNDRTETTTTYFVTFEIESGKRAEFHVSDNDFGLLIEQDRGKLKFQGSRYLGFERAA